MSEKTKYQQMAEQTYRVFGDIIKERVAQDQKHGGSEHDDQHVPDHWREYIWDHLTRARYGTPMEYRHEMIKVAALVVAAIESFDRVNAKKL